MAAQVFSFRRLVRPRDWSQQEIAQFYRVQAALGAAGIRTELERGLSDEGDPWFVFCRADDGHVIIHFARIDGQYVIDGPAYQASSRGPDFSTLVEDIVDRHPLVQTNRARHDNVIMHPMTLLIALVATAFFKVEEGHASLTSSNSSGDVRQGPHALLGTQPVSASGPVQLDARHAAVVLAAILFDLNAGPTDDSLARDKEINKVQSLVDLTASIDADGPSSPQVAASSHVLADETKSDSLQASFNDFALSDKGLSLLATAALLGEVAKPIDNFSITSFVDGLPPLLSSADNTSPLFSNPARSAVHKFDQSPSAAGTEEAGRGPAEVLDTPSTTLVFSFGEGGAVESVIIRGRSFAETITMSAETGALALPELLAPLLQLSVHFAASGSARSLIEASQVRNPDWLANKTAHLGQVDTASGTMTHDLVPTVEMLTERQAQPVTGTMNDRVIADPKELIDRIETFVASSGYHILISGLDLIFYDEDAVVSGSPKLATYVLDFEDGSSISLVGISSDIAPFMYG